MHPTLEPAIPRGMVGSRGVHTHPPRIGILLIWFRSFWSSIGLVFYRFALGQFWTVFALAVISMFRTADCQLLERKMHPFAESAPLDISIHRMPLSAYSANGCVFLLENS